MKMILMLTEWYKKNIALKNAIKYVFCRSLCVDALIELSDENADWKLSFDEFLNCLRPGFNPPERSKIYNHSLHFLVQYIYRPVYEHIVCKIYVLSAVACF